MLLLHIATGIFTIAITFFTFLFPSRVKMFFSVLSFVVTIVTGGLLVAVYEYSIVRVCTSSVVFSFFVSHLLYFSYKKLHRIEKKYADR